jgi:hypothetical protein
MKRERKKVIQAERLEVIDRKGRKRIVLGALDIFDGTPDICLFDGKGNVRAWLFLTPDGLAELRFFGLDGGTTAVLGTLPDGKKGRSIFAFRHDEGNMATVSPPKRQRHKGKRRHEPDVT